jgi:hypothetical protein
MIKYFKKGKDGWSNWSRPNDEGVSSRDAVFAFCFGTGMFLLFANIFFYLECHPDVTHKIAHIIFPLATCK